MSSPPKKTLPSMRALGTSSCIRLSERRKLDLPQPLGPMMAVIFLDGIASVTSSIAFFSPAFEEDRFSILYGERKRIESVSAACQLAQSTASDIREGTGGSDQVASANRVPGR